MDKSIDKRWASLDHCPHDFQATVLHLLNLDHEQLTYRFQGRDFRLTDVAGHVVEKLLA